MAITPLLAAKGRWSYRVEYDDGTVAEEVGEIPEAFGSLATGTVFDKEIPPSEYVLLLESQLGIRLNDADEFMRMVESPAFETQLAALSGEARQAFVLTVLQRAEYIFDSRDAVPATHPIARFVNDECRHWLFEHWSREVSPDGKVYNFVGVLKQLQTLESDSPEVQYQFLRRIMAERAEPIACEFPDHRGGDDDRTPFITVLYPHPLTHAELESLRFRLSALQRECEGAGSEALSASAPPLMWEGRLTDLVFIIDALKACGYLTATDASILANVSFRSESSDRAKVYRGTRKKLKDGDSYPDNKRLELLIEELRKGLDVRRR